MLLSCRTLRHHNVDLSHNVSLLLLTLPAARRLKGIGLDKDQEAALQQVQQIFESIQAEWQQHLQQEI